MVPGVTSANRDCSRRRSTSQYLGPRVFRLLTTYASTSTLRALDTTSTCPSLKMTIPSFTFRTYAPIPALKRPTLYNTTSDRSVTFASGVHREIQENTTSNNVQQDSVNCNKTSINLPATTRSATTRMC